MSAKWTQSRTTSSAVTQTLKTKFTGMKTQNQGQLSRCFLLFYTLTSCHCALNALNLFCVQYKGIQRMKESNYYGAERVKEAHLFFIS